MKKVVVFLLLIALISQFIPLVSAEEPEKQGYYTWDGYYIPTEEEVYNSIVAMQEQYPERTPWTNDNRYNGNIFGGAGCAGFAWLLSDAAFGNVPQYAVNRNFTYDDVRIGDIFRYKDDKHSVIILEKYEDHVVVAEGNYNGMVHWFRSVKRTTIEEGDYISTRYPATPYCYPGEPVITPHVPATCLSMGDYIYTLYCEDCGVQLKRETVMVMPLGHEFSVYVKTVYATPIYDGYDIYKCVRCSQTEKRNYVKAHPHVYGSAVRENDVAPTCTEPGSYETVFYCKTCQHETLRKSFTVDPLGHDFSIEKEVIPPTKDTEGYTVYQCSRCEETERRDFTHICVSSPVVTENNIPPQCVVDGGYDLVTYCSICQKELNRKHNTVPAAGHDFSMKLQTVPSTKTEEGYTIYRCLFCNETEHRDFTPLHICTPSEPIKMNETAPTCEQEGGYDMVVVCTECGDEIRGEHFTIDALGHEYNEAITAPTCEAQGFTTHTCSRCDHSYIDSYMNALGHNYDAVITEPSCENQGFTTHTCSVCENTYTDDVVAPLGHDIIYDAAVSPSCVIDGLTAGWHCGRCDCKKEQEPIAAHGHQWEKGDVLKEPTETECGIQLYVCGICTETRTEEIEKLEPKIPEDPCLGFTDIDRNAWYHNAVDYAITKGYMNGMPGGLFAPNGNVSRAQLVQILYNLEGKPSVSYSGVFEDVLPNQWYTDAVIWAAQNDIVSGIGNHRFAPNNNVTREQMAVILFGYLATKGVDITIRADISSFGDMNKISNWAVEAFQWANGVGLINGIQSGDSIYLAPQGTATRSQIAQVFYSYFTNGIQTPKLEPDEHNPTEPLNPIDNPPIIDEEPIEPDPPIVDDTPIIEEEPIIDNDPIVNEHQHDYQCEVVSPTCTTQGYTVYACDCGESCKENIVESLGHEYLPTTTAPTRTMQGYTEYICSRCGHSYIDDYVSALPEERIVYDVSIAVAAGNAYAESLGATIDYSLGFDNAGYCFPEQRFPDYDKTGNFEQSLIDGLYWSINEVKSLGERNGCDFSYARINCYIEYHPDDNSYWLYVFYG